MFCLWIFEFNLEIITRKGKIMKTIQINHYEFTELSKEAQERAINEYYEYEDYPFLEQELLEELNNLDTLKLFRNVELIYSFNYSQGDGLSFKANVDKDKLLKQFCLKNNLSDILYNYTELSVDNKNRIFASKNDICWEFNAYQADAKYPKLYDKFESIVNFLENYYIDICYKLEKFGYSIIEYRMSVEEFAEFSQSNGYMYLKNGTMV